MDFYEPDRHLELKKVMWDLESATSYLIELGEETERAFDPIRLWAPHPDDEPSDQSVPFVALYHGASGVIWAQKELAQRNICKLENDYVEALQIASNSNHSTLAKYPPEYRTGLLLGELGIAVAKSKLDGALVTQEEIETLALSNVSNSICEYMWGSPGTLSYVVSYLEEHDSPVMVRFVQEAVAELGGQLIESPSLQCNIWSQALYGFDICYIGAVHGFAGNAFSILKACDYINIDDRSNWANRIRDTIVKSAITDSAYANWPQSIDGERPGRTQLLVQFCHGAPGIVCSLSGLMNEGDDAFDQLLSMAGELIWRAGPLEKGSNICHGTSGNGYAFLKLFEVTQNEIWLDRARAFAMFAIEQSKQRKKKVGAYRYSLWTGDTGLALYIASCIDADARIPTMDYF